LQGRFDAALKASARFVINSTVGVFGLFDVAGRAGLPRNDQDFGLTLARWGVDSGPYVVLPILGPRTVRDSAGAAVDVVDPWFFVDGDRTIRYGLSALRLIDTRAGLLDAETLITGDRYVFIRDAWLQQRRFRITGELPLDDFGDDEFDF
jgi:phospholipid-binding lipoprotein MlaA